MTTEPEDFTSESIRRKALSAAIDDLQRAYDRPGLRPSAVLISGTLVRLQHMREVLKNWPNPDDKAWTTESARARVGATFGT